MRSALSVGIGRFLVASGLVLYLSACSGNTVSSNSNASNPAPEHLYVIASTGQMLQFTLPLTSASTPSVTVPSTGSLSPILVAVDSNGNLAVTGTGGNLAIYRPPLTGSSTPAAVFPNGTLVFAAPIAFDSKGNLFAGGSVTSVGPVDTVNIFSPPFSSASTPSQVLSISRWSGGLDSNGNLYLVFGLNVGPCGIDVLAPPYTGTPSTFVSRTCVDGNFGGGVVADNQLFVDFFDSNIVVINDLPLPGSTATSGGLTFSSLSGTFTADSNGNIYLANNSSNTISVFAPPFSSTSPTVTVSNVPAIVGMAIGK